MQIQENVSLSNYSTMRLGGPAKYLATISSEDELLEALNFAKQKVLAVKVLGGGSNVIITDAGFSGLVIINEIKGFEITDDCLVKIGAGETWDTCVERTVERGLTGIEALSLIPGTAGGTPVQNVGAYGQEIKDTFVKLRAYDIQSDEWVEFDNVACEFAYRKSIFNTSQKDRYIITKMWLQLHKALPQPPFYTSVQQYFDEHDIVKPNNNDLRQAVIAVRSAKLPNPKILPNTGSFFHNPVVDKTSFDKLLTQYPEIPHYKHGEMVKIPAAWLIEQAGLKDYRDSSGLATYDKQPLVIVNRGAKSEKDLENFKKMIVDKIQKKFDITLEQEPETVYDNT